MCFISINTVVNNNLFFLSYLQMINSDRIINELAERIRVVSGLQSFSFPVWFADIVVGVRVGKGSSN